MSLFTKLFGDAENPADKKELAKSGSRKLFWAWVIYQTIKGILTTSLIWIPMLYLWFKG